VSERLRFQVINEDIVRAATDILVLKYADSFHGADRAVATAIGYSDHLEIGDLAFVRG